MPNKLRIYLDTSVPNACFDMKNPERREITNHFWKKKERYHFFISELVVEEIRTTGNKKKRDQLLDLIRDIPVLTIEEKGIGNLAREYVRRGVIPVKHIEDAVHIVTASFHSVDALVSWNFEYIVKLKTKREVNVINVLSGYRQLEIVEPTML